MKIYLWSATQDEIWSCHHDEKPRPKFEAFKIEDKDIIRYLKCKGKLVYSSCGTTWEIELDG